MSITEKCPNCSKEISEEEFVVNWGSCADCFSKHIDAYFALRNHSPLTKEEAQEVWRIEREGL